MPDLLLAVQVLLSRRQRKILVVTVDTVNGNFYVDDYLKSVATVPEAFRLANQLVQLFAKGGFHFTKWVSNSREVLQGIPPGERALSIANLDLEDVPIDLALGT